MKTNFGMGIHFSLKEVVDGWQWRVKRFTRVLAEGNGATKKEAEEKLKKALGEQMLSVGVKQAERTKWRLKLRSYVERRPYLAAWVVEGVMAGLEKGAIGEQAYEMEVAWSKKDPKEVRHPISRHHLSVTPEKGARAIYECFEALGLAEPAKAERWGKETLGERYFGGEE